MGREGSGILSGVLLSSCLLNLAVAQRGVFFDATQARQGLGPAVFLGAYIKAFFEPTARTEGNILLVLTARHSLIFSS